MRSIGSEALIQNVDLSTLTSPTGFVTNGAAAGDQSGTSVNGAGDVNADGIDDILIGAPLASPIVGGVTRSGAGIVYVIFGSPTTSIAGLYTNLNLASFATAGSSLGFAIYGAVGGDNIGFSVSRAGDINYDGIDDIIAGSQMASPVVDSVARNLAGAAYVIFGRDATLGATSHTNIDLLLLNTAGSTLGFAIFGALAGDRCGYSVSAAGDVNRDKVDDLVVGAYYSSPNTGVGGAAVNQAGVSYVVFGRSGGPVSYTNIDLLPLFTAGSGVGFAIYGTSAGEYSGRAVGGGDVNGDGISDVVVGAVYAGPVVGGVTRASAGATYVVFGRSYLTGTAAYVNVNLADFASAGTSIGFIIQGGVGGDSSGRAVAVVGDVNGDGVSDIILGARLADAVVGTSRVDAGIAYVIFGRSILLDAALSYTNIDLFDISTTGNTLGYAIYGAASSDYCGHSVGGAGDVDGDGINDVIVGCISADPLIAMVTRASAGTAYVIYGRHYSTGANAFANVDLALINVASSAVGFAIFGAVSGESSGQSVSRAGDVNNDGTSDVLVGAHLAAVNGASSGSSYVVFGVSTFPTVMPTAQPSRLPTIPPVVPPTVTPSFLPSSQPSSNPSAQPSSLPTTQPTRQPSSQPSCQPSSQPTSRPSTQPSMKPSSQPSAQPSGRPSHQPSSQPSSKPTTQPTTRPTVQPTGLPSAQPSGRPTTQPSVMPSSRPSAQPSAQPSRMPSTQPRAVPTTQPSPQPSLQPSTVPSGRPSTQPSSMPSSQPTARPSGQSTSRPSSQPSSSPSGQPSLLPSMQSSSLPSSQPTVQPSCQPSTQPSVVPSSQPTTQPTSIPLSQPSTQPSCQPTSVPSSQPTSVPSAYPTIAPPGEWVATLNEGALLNRVFYIDGNVWACGTGVVDVVGSNSAAVCVLAVHVSGEIVREYQFDWSRVTAVLSTNASITISGEVTDTTVQTSEVATCVHSVTQQLQCIVMSLQDTLFVSAAYVPLAKVRVYVGWHNVYASISVVDPIMNIVQSYIYTAYNMKSLVLSHVQSLPHFSDVFVAGTAVRATATSVHYIVAGMVHTDSCLLNAMAISPVSGDIVSSVDVATAMALEATGPDSFIAGGLQLSNDTVKHAYVVRVNALYMTVVYCMQYRVVLHENRRALSTNVANALHSVVRGMVLVDPCLFMVIERATAANLTALTVLKTSTTTGAIVKQVHIYATNDTSLVCTDVTTAGALLSIICTVNNSQSRLFAVDQDLTFARLPHEYVRSEDVIFYTQNVPMQRTVLNVAKSETVIAADESEVQYDDRSHTSRPPPVTATATPSVQPSSAPSAQPSSSPTSTPSVSARPTSTPSTSGPTNTYRPSVEPTPVPTRKPTVVPTVRPSVYPSWAPTVSPSLQPTAMPTQLPSVVVSTKPSVVPSSAIERSSSPNVVSTHPTTRAVAPTPQPSSFDDSATTSAKTNTNMPFIVGGSVGGALVLLVVGYIVSRYSRDEEKNKANELRRTEHLRRQALLAEQTRSETAKYFYEERSASTGGKVSKIAPARDVMGSKIEEIEPAEQANTLNPSLSITSLHRREDNSGSCRSRARSRLDSVSECSVHSSDVDSPSSVSISSSGEESE